MTRTECQNEIMAKLKEIVEIYHKYNPAGTYLSMTYLDDDWLNVNNRYYNEESPDYELPIQVYSDINN